jgi:hypothetical protein
MDWAFAEAGISLAYTVEIRPTRSVDSRKRPNGFNAWLHIPTYIQTNGSFTCGVEKRPITLYLYSKWPPEVSLYHELAPRCEFSPRCEIGP